MKNIPIGQMFVRPLDFGQTGRTDDCTLMGEMTTDAPPQLAWALTPLMKKMKWRASPHQSSNGAGGIGVARLTPEPRTLINP